MRNSIVRTFAIAAIAALALAACGSSSKSSSGSSGTTQAPATTAASSDTTAASGGTPTVALAAVTSTKVPSADKVLVDNKGKTLYLYDKDPSGKVTCTGACQQAWPPYYVTGTPTYGTGVSGSQFSIITTADGDKQLAVNGHALYRWINDKKAGDATGQDVNNFYVVAATGKKVDAG